VIELGGELHEVAPGKSPGTQLDAILADRDLVWCQICFHALERKQGDINAAEPFAKAQYRNLYNAWPRHSMRSIEPVPAHPSLLRKIQQQIIAWSRRQKAA
jgi:hypothetical protein